MDLIVYCKSVSLGSRDLKNISEFRDPSGGSHWDEMSSFNEIKAKEVMIDSGARAAFQWRHLKNLARLYPKVNVIPYF